MLATVRAMATAGVFVEHHSSVPKVHLRLAARARFDPEQNTSGFCKLTNPLAPATPCSKRTTFLPCRNFAPQFTHFIRG